MHTSLLHMFSRKQTVLTFCPECFWSLLNGIRAFILVKHRKMFDFYSRRKKDICWRSFFVCKILQLFSSFSYFWVWSLAGQFGICMEDHYCQENRWRESKYLPADLKHFHFVSFKIFNFCLNEWKCHSQTLFSSFYLKWNYDVKFWVWFLTAEILVSYKFPFMLKDQFFCFNIWIFCFAAIFVIQYCSFDLNNNIKCDPSLESLKKKVWNSAESFSINQ